MFFDSEVISHDNLDLINGVSYETYWTMFYSQQAFKNKLGTNDGKNVRVTQKYEQ